MYINRGSAEYRTILWCFFTDYRALNDVCWTENVHNWPMIANQFFCFHRIKYQCILMVRGENESKLNEIILHAVLIMLIEIFRWELYQNLPDDSFWQIFIYICVCVDSNKVCGTAWLKFYMHRITRIFGNWFRLMLLRIPIKIDIKEPFFCSCIQFIWG